MTDVPLEKQVEGLQRCVAFMARRYLDGLVDRDALESVVAAWEQTKAALDRERLDNCKGWPPS